MREAIRLSRRESGNLRPPASEERTGRTMPAPYRALLAAGVAVLVVALVLAIPGVRILFVPGLARLAFQGNELPSLDQTLSPARELDLAPHIHLSVPEGALDRETTFSAAPLDPGTAHDLADQTGLVHPILFSFEFSGGLGPEAEFAQEVRIELDLDGIGIPEAIRSDMAAVRVGTDGMPVFLRHRVEGGRMILQTRRNSVIHLIGIPFLVAISGLLLRMEDQGKYGSQSYRLYRIPGEAYSGYTLYWPASRSGEAPRNPGRIDGIRRDIRVILERTGLQWSEAEQRFLRGPEDREYAMGLLAAMDMPEYRRLQGDLQCLDFLLEYVYPEKLALVVERLVRAHDYLYGVRKFPKPWFGVDLVLRDPWPPELDNVLGLSIDQTTKLPYVAVNLSGFSSGQEIEAAMQDWIRKGSSKENVEKMRSRDLELQKGDLDSLQGTLAHELFHVIQEEYANHVLQENPTFCEASALLLESEAIAHFRMKGLLLGTPYTLADHDRFELLSREWGTPLPVLSTDEQKKEAQDHGYTFYRVLKFNRDTYAPWAANPDGFLPALMQAYTYFGAVTGLLATSRQNLMQAYARFDGAAILERLEKQRFALGQDVFRLDISQPLARLTGQSFRSDSIQGMRLSVNAGSTQAVVFLRLDGIDGLPRDHVGLVLAEGAASPATFRTIPLRNAILVLPAEDHTLLVTQESALGMAEITTASCRMQADLSEPILQPTIRYEKRNATFIVNLPEESHEVSASYRGRLIEIVSVDNADIKPYRRFVPAGSREVRIPIESILYGDEDRVSVMEQMLARALAMTAKTGLRAASRMPNDSFALTESDGLFRFTRKEPPPDSGEEPDDEADAYIDKTFTMAVEARDGVMTAAMVTDKNFYMTMELGMGPLLDYLKYARPLFAQVDVRYEKELAKYDSTFSMTVREVFSTQDQVDPQRVALCERVMGQVGSTVAGPPSRPLEFKGEGLVLEPGVRPGTYTGRMFVSFLTNMENNLGNEVRVVVGTDQSVRVTLGGEILEGRLAPAARLGHFQFQEKIVKDGNVTYRPVSGATALFAEDGTLVFSFVPVRLRRTG